MWKDPIVEEVRAVRQAFAAQYDYDLKKIFEALRAEQEKHPERVVSFAPEARRRRPRRKGA